MRLRFFLGLTAWALAAVQCADPLERYETGIYRLKPAQMPPGPRMFENRGHGQIERFCSCPNSLSAGAPLDAPAPEFLSPQPEQERWSCAITG
jgi:hypothetical protein